MGVDPGGRGQVAPSPPKKKMSVEDTNIDAPTVSACYVHLCYDIAHIMLYLPFHPSLRPTL